ncbi:MAG: sensor histidine kinase [Candidatus Dormibacteria bacterium]
MQPELAVFVEVLLTALAAAGVYFLLRRRQRAFGSVEEEATLKSLEFASTSLKALRRGLTAKSAARVLPQVLDQAGATACAIYTERGIVAFTGEAAGHQREGRQSEIHEVGAALRERRMKIVRVHPAANASDGCPLSVAVITPLTADSTAPAALVTYYTQQPSVAALRISSDLGELLSTQLRLRKADEAQSEVTRAELRALRAQISPHFIYNTLTTISSFVRTDPERARELINEFADFTRLAFKGPTNEYTTLAEELVYVHKYLLFERARFGDRLQIRVQVEPEVLGTVIPILTVQPLVENAVKHGIEMRRGRGRVTIDARDQDDECLILVHDDGPGFDATDPRSDEGGGGALRNIDDRLRRTFGPAYGLAIDSGTKKGTSISFRVPKYRSGVRVS